MTLRQIITKEQIDRRVNELAAQIRRDYEGKEVAVVAVMTGAVFFLVDLLRRVDLPVRLDVLQVKSYNGTATSGSPRIVGRPALRLQGRHVLIIDDILDTGLTLQSVVREVKKSCPESLKICVLLSKKRRREADIQADYCAFEIADEFVVGYGLDYDGQFRYLPYIAAIDEG
ncbi:MAG TPA: hypoxanthine phosphoribosyltransferase [Planctomycetota bacterium]|nr:hypoxanthine phosphoribosyltransferase [Planctomycetota bacterium]